MAGFRLTSTAAASLRAIGAYTELHWGRTQRHHYIDMIHAQFEMLAKSPHRGRLRDDLQPGLREHHAGSHTIFYVVEPKRITIVDILHERMDPALHLS